MIKRLLPYKDLFLVYIWREFNIRYRQSYIGALWAVIQPLSMMLLFTFVFTYLIKAAVSDYPKTIFFYSGLLPWTFFASSVNYSLTSLTGNYFLITKIYFPREILPLSGIVMAFLDYVIASVIFIPMLFIYHIHITYYILWMVPLLVLLFVFTISMSLLLSSLNVYYRDVKLATGFLIQLLFFASPVLYSIDDLSLNFKLVLFLNPMTFIIENMRRCLIEGRGVVLWQFVFVSAIVAVFYYLSYRFFIKTERDFADVI
ncbi:MAG TPA: ABC transporter permease [Thermodesulfobacteriota bacterium]|nr:ABC transporter permease [Thermodesulfobacteriota bacterium]